MEGVEEVHHVLTHRSPSCLVETMTNAIRARGAVGIHGGHSIQRFIAGEGSNQRSGLNLMSLRVEASHIEVPGDRVGLPQQTGEVGGESSRLGSMRDMALSGRVHNCLDLVPS